MQAEIDPRPLVANLDATFVVAPEGLEAETQAELGPSAARVRDGGRLFRAPAATREVAWSSNVWLDPVRIRFETSQDAAKALRSIGPRWSLLRLGVDRSENRTAESIAKLTGSPKNAPIAFPTKLSSDALGAFAVVGPGEIFASARCASPFADGAPTFVEDRRGPPSRAYLKLWEAWTRLGRWPGWGERCIDLGSSPGGWTWAMQRLDAWVLSVDKAPLDPRIARLPRVECRRASAFSLDPTSVGRLDWIVSDVICYPARILSTIDRWIDAHPAASFVVTIKFQGETDVTPVRSFVERRGGTLVHLLHNKHELTWMRPGAARKDRAKAGIRE